MARLPGNLVPGLDQHVIQRGNNRQDVFYADRGYLFYLDAIGNQRFREQIARALKRRVETLPHGGDRKSEAFRSQRNSSNLTPRQFFYTIFVYATLLIRAASRNDECRVAGPGLGVGRRSESEGIHMKKLTKMISVGLLAGATALPLSSAQAWWGGPGWGGGGPWGYRDWTDGLGDMLGDLWGDIDFRMYISARGRGNGYGRGYGDYYDYYGYGPYGYPGYWGGYPVSYAPGPWGYPGYAAPYGVPVQPQVISRGQK